MSEGKKEEEKKGEEKKKAINSKDAIQRIKLLPPMIALSACLISCIVSILQQVDFAVFVSRMALSAIIFLVIGYIARIALWYVFKPDLYDPESEDDGSGEGSDEDITVDEEITDKDE